LIFSVSLDVTTIFRSEKLSSLSKTCLRFFFDSYVSKWKIFVRQKHLTRKQLSIKMLWLSSPRLNMWRMSKSAAVVLHNLLQTN
jgi:hypothetical protein